MIPKLTPFIPPFPSNIDRKDFGHWLSGFVDGEGCFMLKRYLVKGKSKIFEQQGARFEILLRIDDLPILEQIQSFLGVGRIGIKNRTNGVNRAAVFYVSATSDHYNVMVPHFEEFPLRAKKSADFAIWKKGVDQLYRLSLRRTGSIVKWTAEEKLFFYGLLDELKQTRTFTPHT